MDLSIIIVNFKTKDRLRQCLRSVFASETSFRFQVWVVDNASHDGSGEMVGKEFPEVKFTQNQENVGYAKANNQVLKSVSDSRYFLLLNPDVEVSANTFDKMVGFMDNNPGVGISGCKVLKSDGSFDEACRRNFPNPVNAFLYFSGIGQSDYHLDLPESETSEVDSVMGAFLLISKTVLEKVGFLDEDFFMYGEDLDWCWRTKAAGFKVVYAPLTSVKHYKGSSSKKLPGKALYEFHRAMQIFYNKHYRQNYNFLINFLVVSGIWLRYIVKATFNSLKKEKYVSK